MIHQILKIQKTIFYIVPEVQQQYVEVISGYECKP